jgi:tetratricopeptide (TPR) repeat protein
MTQPGQGSRPSLDLEALRATADAMQDGANRARAWTTLALAQAAAGELAASRASVEEARRVADGLTWGADRAQALAELAVVLARLGDATGTDDLFAAAEQVARALDNAYFRVAALRDCATSRARAGRHPAARALLAEAAQSSYDIEDDAQWYQRLQSVAEAQRALARARCAAGDFAEARALADEIEHADERTAALTEVAMAQVGAGELGGALHTAEAIPNDTYWGVSRHGYRRQTRWTHGHIEAEIRRHNEQRRKQAEVQQAVARALARRGDFDAAVTTARAIGDAYDRVETLALVSTYQRRAGLRDTARMTFDEALAGANEAIVPAALLCRLVRQQVQERNLSAALQAVGLIDERSSRAEALAQVAVAHSAGGNGRAARTLLAQALQPERKQAQGSEHLEALQEIAKAQAVAGDRHGAVRTLSVARPLADRLGKEWHVALDLARLGEFDAGLEIGRAGRQSGRNYALQEIAAAQARAGDFTAALRTAAELTEDYPHDHALREVQSAQIRAGRFAEAVKVAEQFRGDWDRVWALRDIAEAQLKAGQHADGQRTFQAAVEVARGHRTVQERRVSLGGAKRVTLLVMTGQCQARLGEVLGAQRAFDLALELAQGMDDTSDQVKAMVEVAAAQREAGYQDSARATLASAARVARAIRQMAERHELLQEVAACQARVGEYEEALETARGIGSQWDATLSERQQALQAIAQAQAQAGNLPGALRTAEEIGEGIERNRALRSVAEQQAKLGEFAAASETAGRISYEWERSSAMAAVAEQQAERGEFVAAWETIGRIVDDGDRSAALKRLAECQAEAGDLEAALRTARTIPNVHERVRSLVAVAEHFARCGDPRALEILRHVDPATRAGDLHLRTEALLKLARMQVEAGYGAQALQTAEAILTERDVALPRLAGALAKAGDRENFKRLLVPCAYAETGALKLCGLLAQLYPSQATALTRLVMAE